MTREDKVRALEVFNDLDASPWSDDHRKRFMANYRAFANSMTKPIQAWVASRRPNWLVVVELAPGAEAEVHEGTYVLPGMGYDKMLKVEGCEGKCLARTFTIQAAAELVLGKVTPEATDNMIERIANALARMESEALQVAKNQFPGGMITMYIRQKYEAHDDPTLIKRKKIGVFGWEELAVTATP